MAGLQETQTSVTASNGHGLSTELAATEYDSWDECREDVSHVLEALSNVNPFIDIGWMEAWWEQWGHGKKLRIIVVSRDGKPIGFAPLYFTTSPGGREYFFVGHRKANYLELGHLTGYGKPALDTLVAALMAEGTPALLHLMDVNSESETFAALQAMSAAGEFEVDLKWLYPCPYARLSDDWADYYATVMRRKRRVQVNAAEDRLGSLGKVGLRVLTTPEEVEPVWSDLQRLHTERFHENYNPSLEGRHRSFMEDLLRLRTSARPVVAVLELDSIPVAFLIGFRMGNGLIDYIPALDPALERYSPGHVLIKRLTAWMISEGLNTLDFSKGEEVYKRRWSNGQTENYLATIAVNARPRLRLYQQFTRGKEALRVAMRSRGYGRVTKRWWAAIRNTVRRQELSEPKVRLTTSPPSNGSEPFRYERVATLPVTVRRALAEFAYRHRDSELFGTDQQEHKAALFDHSSDQGIEVSW